MAPKPEQSALAFEAPAGEKRVFVLVRDPLDREPLKLFRGAEPVKLQQQSLRVLQFLAENAGADFERQVIYGEVWQTSSDDPELNVLTKHVQFLRKEIGSWCILTSKGCYRFGAVPRAPSPEEFRNTRERPAAKLPPSRKASAQPYVGSLPFASGQSHLFFGREKACADLIQLLEQRDKRAVLVHSPSGGGKTSLIHTTLRDGLTERGFRVILAGRLGTNIEGLPAGEPAAGENLYTASAVAGTDEKFRQDYAMASNWTSYLSAVGATGKTVLILDQLEDILRTERLGPPGHRREFFLQLRDALRAFPEFRVLLAFRQEYLSSLIREARDLESYWTLYRLDPLTQEEAREAIERPARDVLGVSFDAAVLDALVAGLACHRYVDALGHSYDEPGDSVEPLQLQVVCEALWNRLPKARVDRITWSDIHQALPEGLHDRQDIVNLRDGVPRFIDFVLADFCGSAIDEIAKSLDFPAESIDLGCRQFLKGGLRLLVYRDENCTGPLPNFIVEALAQRHLLRVEERYGGSAYELAHDTLIEPIRARSERITTQKLENLWRNVLQEIARSPWAKGEGLDFAALVEMCFLDFVDDRGSALRVSGHASGHGKSGRELLDELSRRGLIKPIGKDYSLCHPELAPALRQIHSASKDRDLRPLTSVVRIVFVSVTAIGATVLVTMLSRAVVAGGHLTLTQAPDVGVFAGWFQGVIGALVWAACIAPALTRRWYVTDHGHERESRRWIRWGFTGLLAGLVGGVFITVALMKAQRPDSLRASGWVVGDSLWSAFNQTGYGWTMLLFGPGVGWGAGAASMRILLSREWRILVSGPKPASIGRTGRMFLRTLSLAMRRGGHILAPIGLMAGALDWLVYAMSHRAPALARIAGEGVSIGFGDIGLVAGLLFGLYLVEKGVDIRAEDLREPDSPC